MPEDSCPGSAEPLWRDRVFARVWLSFTLSQFGGSVTVTVLPLIAASALHASPLQMGILATVNTLPFLVIGPFAGVMADRLPRRAILIGADAARSIALLAGAAAALTGHLRLEVLYAVAFAFGAGHVWFDIARSSYLPVVVRRDRLITANGHLSVSQAFADTALPSFGGLIFQALGTAFALFACSATYALSALLLHSLDAGRPVTRQNSASPVSVLGQMRQGISFILASPLLRAVTLRLAAWQLIAGGILSLLVLFLVNEAAFAPAEIGVFFSIMGIGTLVAAVSVNRISAWIGVGPTIMISNLVAATVALLIPLSGGGMAGSTGLIGVTAAVYGFCVITYQINNASLRQALTPAGMLGRMAAATRFCTLTLNACGAVVAGVVAQYRGVRFAITCFAVAGVCLAIRGAVSSPLRSARRLPASPEQD
jgi:MFS family permease